jgi:hypothetical protein
MSALTVIVGAFGFGHSISGAKYNPFLPTFQVTLYRSLHCSLELKHQCDVLCTVCKDAGIQRPLLENGVGSTFLWQKQTNTCLFDLLPCIRRANINFYTFSKPSDKLRLDVSRASVGDIHQLQVVGIGQLYFIDVEKRICIVSNIKKQLDNNHIQ